MSKKTKVNDADLKLQALIDAWNNRDEDAGSNVDQWKGIVRDQRLKTIADDYYTHSDSLYTPNEVYNVMRDLHIFGGDPYINKKQKTDYFDQKDSRGDYVTRPTYSHGGRTYGLPDDGFIPPDGQPYWMTNRDVRDTLNIPLNFDAYSAEFGGHGLPQFSNPTYDDWTRDSLSYEAVRQNKLYGDYDQPGGGKYNYQGGIEDQAHFGDHTYDQGTVPIKGAPGSNENVYYNLLQYGLKDVYGPRTEIPEVE
ncbi:MAG: hypothetical protein Unbinned5123contig1000_16 [Prokaryotic dsDNA virus sp.]|nr:MAG: hypothetical protein Unbinned5123contig1000_16 [Prokaryotic dsDNA virus sp.]|tara:strand:+ start:35437 stop:36189 length:753 start_codon:yes stop_codon:yes gene_type:complete